MRAPPKHVGVLPNDDLPVSSASVRPDGGRGTATVSVDADDASDWAVNPNVLGKFTEMNAREGYPGIYSEHVANGSFEEWYTWPKRTPEGNPAWWRRSEVLYRDTEPEPGVAYPWESAVDDATRATFEHPVGGRHGRESGATHDDVHGRPYREPEPRYQRVTVDEGRAGVRQRLALPDRRTRAFDLSFSVRGVGLGRECEVRVTDPGGAVLSNGTVAFDGEWARRELSLELDAESAERYRGSPFGRLALSFWVEGRGHVDLDWVRLRAGDAVAGKFNPTTVEHVREYGVPSIRWPGGNFVSQYTWRDGVGPVEERPVRSELHWGGLEPNYLGVDEFLEFCEVADVEPYLNVGFSGNIGPAKAAEMVEYVNGSTDTEMGSLRAEHGREDPWNVEMWQVGNEVWGEFQIGHADAATYAERYVDYHEAMTDADPDITVMAVGVDPADEPRGGNEWNETLFDIAGDAVTGVDIHRYVNGDASERRRDPVEFNQQLVLYPTRFATDLRTVVDAAEDAGLADLRITVGEWNMGARGLEDGPRAEYGTVAHAAFCAGMYNAFIREGDAVEFGHQRDNAFKHRPYPSDLRPAFTANNAVLRRYTEVLADGREWNSVPAPVDGPTGRIERQGGSIAPADDVPFVDAAAVRSADGEDVRVFVVNRNLTDPFAVRVDLPTDGGPVAATVVRATDDPLDPTTEWSGETSYEVEERSPTVDDGGATLELPPGAVARLDAGGDAT